MFTLPSESQGQKKSQVHLLPCRIHHDGEVGPVESYWNPIEGEGETTLYFAIPQTHHLNNAFGQQHLTGRTGGQKTAYFRGRKLHGKTMKLPAGYHGAVVEKGEPKPVDADAINGDGDAEIPEEDREEPLEVGALSGKTSFDEIVVWGHEAVADSSDDPYVRGVEEWISFAEQVSSACLSFFGVILCLFFCQS